MNSELFFFIVLLGLVFISSCSQIVLKKAADRHYENKLREYLNFPVLFSYFLFFTTTIAVVFILEYVPVSFVSVSQMSAYIFVAVLSRIFLKEKLTPRKAAALLLILTGIGIFVI